MVLAAGQSSRLGRPKQLLELGGKPVLEHVLRAAAASSLDGIVLVVGHEAERVRAAVGDHGQRVVVNSAYREGQATSLAAGLRALPSDADGAIILLGDQPQISPHLVDTIVGAARATGRDDVFIQPSFRGKRGNPVLIGRRWFVEVMAQTGDVGAREVLKNHPDAVVTVPVEGEQPLLDIDTEADYAAIRDVWTARTDQVN